MANPVNASTPVSAFYLNFAPTREIAPAAKPTLDSPAGATPPATLAARVRPIAQLVVPHITQAAKTPTQQPAANVAPLSPSAAANLVHTGETLSRLFGAQQVGLEPILGGQNCRGAYKIWIDDCIYFAKVLHESVSEAAFANANVSTELAASRGFGPKLIKFDYQARVRVTDFVEGKQLNHQDMRDAQTCETVVRAFAEMHKAARTGVTEKIDGDKMRQALTHDLVMARKRFPQRAGIALAEQLGNAAIEWLDQKYFHVTMCHGDPQPGNIFVKDGHVSIIDWDETSRDDPMSDIVGFALECDFYIDAMATLASYYGDQANVTHLQYLLARLHVSIYLRRCAENNLTDAKRATQIEYYEELMEADVAALPQYGTR